MKKSYFKKGLFTTLTLSFLTSSAQSGRNYADIFTREIYDQAPLHARAFPNETERGKAIINLLEQKKEQALEEKCLKMVIHKINIYQKEYDLAVNKRIWDTTAASGSKLIIEGIKFGASFIPVVGSGIASLIGALGDLSTGPLSQTVLKRYFSEAQAATMHSEILKLKCEITDLKNGLEYEPIKDIERKYVLQKRAITDKKLIDEIENGLIEVRKSDYIAGSIYPFLGMALNLPLQPKLLINHQKVNEDLSLLLKKFDEHPNFKNYDEGPRKAIESIIIQTATDSIAQANSTIPLKKAYYIWGDPSSGKTNAAREIARFLGLPYYEMTARSAAEFTQMNVEGADRIAQNPNPGWLAKALMETTSSEKQPYKNAFLIINDLDRLLAEPKGATTTLTFLLDFLDPQKSHFNNPYFRTNVDISRLNIIITANHKMEKTDFYDALRTRIFEHIEFPKFRPFVIKEILDNFLIELSNHHYISKMFSFEYRDPMKIVVKYNEMFVQFYGLNNITPSVSKTFFKPSFDPQNASEFIYETGVSEGEKEKITLRELKSKLDNTLNTIKITLIRQGAKWLEEASMPHYTETYKLNLYKQAAFVGNRTAWFEVARIVERDNPNLAKFWYQEAANQDDYNSQNNPGVVYENDKWFPHSNTEATLSHNLVTNNGNTYDPYNIGLIYYYDHKDYKKAFEYFSEAFRAGDARAQHTCGLMYGNGHGVEQNDEKAFNCFMQAAYNGNAAAQHVLGWMYDKGQWVSQNKEIAFKWYELAAHNGNERAQNALKMRQKAIKRKNKKQRDKK